MPVNQNEDEEINCLDLDPEFFHYCTESLKDSLSKMRYKTYRTVDSEFTIFKIEKGVNIDTDVLPKNKEPRKSQKAPNGVPQHLQLLFMQFFKYNWPLPDEARQYLANAFEESVRTNSMDDALYLRPERQNSAKSLDEFKIDRYINFRVDLCERLNMQKQSCPRSDLRKTGKIIDSDVYEELSGELSSLFNKWLTSKTIENRYLQNRISITMSASVFLSYYQEALTLYLSYLQKPYHLCRKEKLDQLISLADKYPNMFSL